MKCTCGHEKTDHKGGKCQALLGARSPNHGGPELNYCTCDKFTPLPEEGSPESPNSA
jgi:hypothetical protein